MSSIVLVNVDDLEKFLCVVLMDVSIHILIHGIGDFIRPESLLSKPSPV
ncbi:hypothetical protein BVRB_7g159430 [Beta vulgaris subsp. vulgaris]|nr:hypothetical protein BVRB_7g159430 [Beta vulgaris subsp. vulgaris]